MDHDTTIRWTLGALMAIAAAMSGFYRRRADRLGGAVEGEPRRSRPFVVLWLAMLAPIILCVWGPSWMRWAMVPVPLPLRWAGVATVIVAIGLLRWMFVHLGTNVTPTARPRSGATLVTTGPYRYLRHPLYSFALLLLAGLAVAAESWLILAIGICAFIAMAIRCRHEEQALLETFGDEYRRYRARTGMFLPAPWRPSRRAAR